MALEQVAGTPFFPQLLLLAVVEAVALLMLPLLLVVLVAVEIIRSVTLAVRRVIHLQLLHLKATMAATEALLVQVILKAEAEAVLVGLVGINLETRLEMVALALPHLFQALR